jgi:hypothetical protein
LSRSAHLIEEGPDVAGLVFPLRFSQQLSADRLVLELREGEGGFCDVADRGWAEHDVLQGALPLGHQCEAAFALVAQGSQQRVTGFRVDVQLAAGGLFTGTSTPAPGSLIAKPPDVRPVPEPGQGEDRLLPAGQGTRPGTGADLAAVLCQQARHEQHQGQRDVKDDTIGQRAGPPATDGILVETSLYRGSAPAGGSPVLSARLPV